jgi:hypothetical protein
MNLDMDVHEVAVSLAVPEEAGEALEGSIVVFRVKMDVYRDDIETLAVVAAERGRKRWHDGTSNTISCSS